MQQRIDGLSAYHSLRHSQGKLGYGHYAGYGMNEETPPLRPVVKRHPETGRACLMAGRHAYGVPGLAEDESERLLEDLVDVACRRRGSGAQLDAGDVGVWDNRRLMHRRLPVGHDEPRGSCGTRGSPVIRSPRGRGAMSYEHILFDVSEGIATITLNRPDRLNAWTGKMAQEVRAAMEAAERAADVKVIILTGAGRGFCSGADMNDLTDISAAGGLEAAPRPAFEPFDPTREAGLPAPADLVRLGLQADHRGDQRALRRDGLLHQPLLRPSLRLRDGGVRHRLRAPRLIAEHGMSWMLPRIVGHSRRARSAALVAARASGRGLPRSASRPRVRARRP
jgi:hypothetical protein